ncbi:MAG: hypothetical protein HKN20_09825 [Gemmatimonadetes bacterium]|nr:hypothetical protein [Gemmatimonadota bacterium]
MEWVITSSDLIVMVLTAAIVAGAVALYRLTTEVNRTSRRLNGILARLEPVVDETAREVREEMREIRRLTGRLNRIADHGERLADTVTSTAIPLAEDVDRIRQSQRYVAAAAKGVAAGFQAWKRTTNGSAS